MGYTSMRRAIDQSSTVAMAVVGTQNLNAAAVSDSEKMEALVNIALIRTSGI